MNSATMKDRLNQLSATLLDLVQQVEGLKALHSPRWDRTVTEVATQPRINKSWTSEEDQIVRDGHGNNLSIREVAKSLSRTVGAVSVRATRMGLSYRKHPRSNAWTEEKDTDLRQFHQQGISDYVIARNMNRTVSAIRKRMSSLGLLQAPGKRKLWTEVDSGIASAAAFAGDSLSQIGRAVGRTPGAVNAQLRRLMSKEDFATYTEISA